MIGADNTRQTSLGTRVGGGLARRNASRSSISGGIGGQKCKVKSPTAPSSKVDHTSMWNPSCTASGTVGGGRSHAQVNVGCAAAASSDTAAAVSRESIVAADTVDPGVGSGIGAGAGFTSSVATAGGDGGGSGGGGLRGAVGVSTATAARAFCAALKSQIRRSGARSARISTSTSKKTKKTPVERPDTDHTLGPPERQRWRQRVGE